MRIFFCILSSFFILIATTQHAYSSDKMNWDEVSDQKIELCLNSDTFQNISLLYPYEQQDWELRVIFNPQYEQIELVNGQPSIFHFYYGVFSKDKIPESLKNHLEDIVKSQLNSLSGGNWGISSMVNGKLTIDYFASATATPAAERSPLDTQAEISKETLQIDKNQEIYDLFEAQTFRKLALNYQWEGQLYSVYLVYNPKREALFCSELSKPVRWLFSMTIEASSYPLSLAKHIKSLVPDELLKDSDSVIDVADWISYFRKNSVSLYKNLQPISLLDRIENPEIDAEIRTLFTSNQLTKKSLYYELDGDFYGVFLIHNPEKLNLKSTLGFDTRENGHLSYTTTWNAKVGIFVDKEAPKELIDHISQLYDLSWWDAYWHLSVHNGDKIAVAYTKNSWKYIYTPYSWYTVMLNAEP